MSALQVQRRALVWGAVSAAVIAAIGGGIGFLVAGWPGVWGAVAGAALAFLFTGLTAASFLVGARISGGSLLHPAFLGSVVGTWFVKLVLFVLAALWLRGQDWLHPGVFGVTAIVAVVASLAVDVVAMARTRVPYVDVELPAADPDEPADDPVG